MVGSALLNTTEIKNKQTDLASLQRQKNVAHPGKPYSSTGFLNAHMQVIVWGAKLMSQNDQALLAQEDYVEFGD